MCLRWNNIPSFSFCCTLAGATDWCPPAAWPPEVIPVEYRGFDANENITLHNGADYRIGKVKRLQLNRVFPKLILKNL